MTTAIQSGAFQPKAFQILGGSVGGTFAVTVDLAVPVEFLLRISSDASAPIEILSSVRIDGGVAVEITALSRNDAAVPVEIVVKVSADAATPVEILSSSVTHTIGVLESLLGIRGDQSVPLENLGALLVTGDGRVNLEIVGLISSDAGVRTEFLSQRVVDAMASLEVLLSGRADSAVPVENVGPAASLRAEWIIRARRRGRR